jgi:hypothetical protein
MRAQWLGQKLARIDYGITQGTAYKGECIYKKENSRKADSRLKAFPIGVGGLAFVVINCSTCHDHRAAVALDEEREKLRLSKACSRHAIKLHEHLKFRFPWGAYVWFECREVVEIDS